MNISQRLRGCAKHTGLDAVIELLNEAADEIDRLSGGQQAEAKTDVRCEGCGYMTHPAPGVPDDVVRDAERYRFLAEKCRSTSERWGGRWSIVIDGPAPKSHDSEDDLNEAIDAAMLTSAQAQKGQP